MKLSLRIQGSGRDYGFSYGLDIGENRVLANFCDATIASDILWTQGSSRKLTKHVIVADQEY